MKRLNSLYCNKFNTWASILNILIVKLSSLGDVLHNLPIVWDIRARYPDAQVDWLVEEGYVELLSPLLSTNLTMNSGKFAEFGGIDRIIPIGLRRWKKNLKRGEFVHSIQEFIKFKANLQEITYDLIIETQGIIKSAFVTRLANRSPNSSIFGLANRTDYSGYEPLARRFYTECIQVPNQCHAVDRSRWVTAAALDAPIPNREDNSPHFYPLDFVNSLSRLSNPLGLIRDSYVLCFHATARKAKCWDEQSWVKLGSYLSKNGLTVVFPWGNPEEKKVSEMLAAKVPGALVPKAFSIQEAYTLIAQAKLTVGVDTGLTHLAAVLGRPTIELYVDSPKWKTEGYWQPNIVNLGDLEASPKLEDVIRSLPQI